MAKRAIDPYEVLGVDRDADADQVKAAFRRRAKGAHPDHGGNADEFANVNTAKIVLLDPRRRAEYDRTGTIGEIGPDNADAHAVQLIHGLLEQILSADEDMLGKDLVKVLRDAFGEQIKQGGQNIKNLRRGIQRCKRMQKRFRRKKVGGDFIGVALKNQLGSMERMIAENQQQIEHRRRAIELLADYEFQPEDQFSGAFARFMASPTSTG